MRIAYLVNRYPTVSHTFVRREIVGLEALGHEVVRYSVRAAPDDLPDPADRAERERTAVVLGQSVPTLLGAAIATAAARPGAVWRAWRAGKRMTPPTPKGLVARAAYLVEACWLARDMRQAGVQHLHAHFGTNPAAVARLAALVGGIPYSFTVHGPDEFDAPLQLDLAGKIADARFVVAISDYGRSQLCRWAGLGDWDKIVVVRCGVDRAAVARETTPAPVEAELCAVARLAPQKGLPLLVEAMAALAARGRTARLAIVGEGDLRPALEAAIARHGLGDRVILLGNRGGADVLGQLRAARAMVLPSFAEGLPVVIMESLAVGTPVVTTAIAGVPELVDAACGWVVPAGTVAPLVEAMEAALDADDAQRARLGAEGARRVAEHHDAARNAALLAAEIERRAA